MEGIARGDESALATLYDRYSGLVYTLCHRILGDWMAAEEVMVGVFWEVWSHADRFDPARATPKTYLLLLARSRALDRWRAGRPMGQTLSIKETDACMRSEGGAPLGQVLRDEARAVVVEALDALSAEQRRAVELAFFKGMSHREIAAALELPLGTVKAHIRRGLARLRDHLEGRSHVGRAAT